MSLRGHQRHPHVHVTPGERWMSARTLSPAYFNPTFLPSLVLRTFALSLAAVWGFRRRR